MTRKLWVLVPVAALFAALWTVKLPYYAGGPGPAREGEPLIHITGDQEFASTGRFILTSVSFQSLNVFQAVGAWLDPARSVVSQSVFIAPGETEQQANERAISDMDESKIDAAYVVLSRLAGY